jgi:uncharacterized protein (DUF2141 family)
MRSQLCVGLSLAGVVVLLATRSDATTSSITVPIGGLRNDQGQIGCLLFASADGFPGNADKAVGHQFVRIASRSATCSFDSIAPGSYAVAAIHDENGNGKLDKNFLGIPTEGYGASRDARGTMGPPKWEDAVFQFPGGAMQVAVTIHY